jgi:hypothetical protein
MIAFSIGVFFTGTPHHNSCSGWEQGMKNEAGCQGKN